jgi:hypothetical protein
MQDIFIPEGPILCMVTEPWVGKRIYFPQGYVKVIRDI